MAFDKTPTTWIPSWSEDGTDISVPIASFPELTAAEADGADGDIRKILFAIMELLWDAWVDTASDDRPEQMTLYKSVSTNAETGVATNTYSVQMVVEHTGTEVADEPA